MIRRTIGLLIALLGGILTLGALLGFRYDAAAIHQIVEAPAFQSILRRLLIDQRGLFQIISYVLTVLIVITPLLTLSRKGGSLGSVVFTLAVLNGLCGWPIATPFMLIVLVGAHLIIVGDREIKLRALSVSTSAGHQNTKPSADQSSEKNTEYQRRGAFRRLWNRFFS